MSTHWDVYCRTCNVGHGLHMNHAEDAMHGIVRARDTLAAIAPLAEALAQVNCNWTSIDLEVSVSNQSIDLKWFVVHAGHDLIPRDEYGRFADQCGEWGSCGHCGAPTRCVSTLDHEGDHDFQRRRD